MEKKLEPKLRFKEFIGDWEEKTFKKFTKINQGLQIPINERFFEGGTNRKFYITNEFLKASSDKKYFIENASENVICVKEDILMTRTGNTGQVVTNVEGAFHNNFFKINFDRNRFSKDYLVYVLKSFYTQKCITRLAGTSTIPDLNHGDFYSIKNYYPTLPEQEKIASFLSSVDVKIEKLIDKKGLLGEYKKGIMQKIFLQEIRFKNENGDNYSPWEEKKYGDLYSFHTTNSLSRDKLNYEDGNVKNIHYGDIHTKFSTLFNAANENVPFINFDVDISKIKEENYCRVGDLVIADASEDYKDIGKTIEILNLNNFKTLAGLHTFLARPKKNQIYIGFMGYLLQSWDVRKQVMKIAQGSKVLSLSTTRLSQVKTQIPCLEEQKKIADFLSVIDKKIEVVNDKIDEINEFKKGLLQQMFV